MNIVIELFTVLATMYFIMVGCGLFEQSSQYLGRNMRAGAKGALVDAPASSLPELFVSTALILTGKPDLVLAGLGVSAGSAVFNAQVIPAFSILYARDKDGDKVDSIKISRSVVIRDGIVLILVECLLIWVLQHPSFTLLFSALLVGSYLIYVGIVTYQSRNAVQESDYEFEPMETETLWDDIKNINLNKFLFKDKPVEMKSALVLLVVSLAVVGIACHFLAGSMEHIGVIFGVTPFIIGVLVASPATSVPDTVLSVGSAKNGENDDAIANSVGSNIFDVTISTPLPILVYLLFTGESGLPIAPDGTLTFLRWAVLGTTIITIGILLIWANNITRKIAYALFGLYGLFVGGVIYMACAM